MHSSIPPAWCLLAESSHWPRPLAVKLWKCLKRSRDPVAKRLTEDFTHAGTWGQLRAIRRWSEQTHALGLLLTGFHVAGLITADDVEALTAGLSEVPHG